MKSVVILQARTNSSRLPGKVLLPINGVPMAILAAKRAANTGKEVVVATSSERSDDSLALIIQSHGFRCFRGSLNNTLDRVVSALENYDNQTVVIRLTADNVFPDGPLLDEMEKEFVEKRMDYMSCNGSPSGLPYGMSVEITLLRHLRHAASTCTLPSDQEHVTPYVIRKFGAKFFQKYKSLNMGHFRCTVDCLDDYLTIQEVFRDVSDPIFEPSLDLVNKLENKTYQPIGSLPTQRLAFGSAQLGSQYGIANKSGQPSKSACEALIKVAISNGVEYLDTAQAYGNSEEMIGQSLQDGWQGRVKVITKLSPLLECPDNATESVVNAFVEASVFRSCSALRVKDIDVLMLHRAAHLSAWNGAVWRRLIHMRQSNLIGELGVSVQSPDELSTALDIPDISYIQMPFNLLDWRWEDLIPKIMETKKLRSLTVHIRSVLLQGLLTSHDDRHWQRANVENVEMVREWLSTQATEYKCINVTDLCISYVNSLPWVDGIAIGMENMSQLIENINIFNLIGMENEQIDAIKACRPKLNEDTLNPALWRSEL